VLPEGGRGSPVNAEGVAFYNRLLDAMEAAGIEPAATMFHCARLFGQGGGRRGR
jgi:beta-glucosidase